jgi:predicted acylesterase/phospholipase RssA
MDCSNNIVENNDIEIPQGKIKHIVISGGSHWGFVAFGIIMEAISCGFLHMDDIESMYMTSAGAIIGCMFSLKIEPSILRDYLIKRPWETMAKKQKHNLLEIYDAKGIIHRGFMENMFEPLLKSVDLSIDITMAELYAYNGIDIHLFVTELNSFQLIDISHTTHPNWKWIDAIYASCTIPFAFTPIITDTECFLDGGIFLNYPIGPCLKNVENKEEILAISLGNVDSEYTFNPITKQSNIIDLISSVIGKIIHITKLFANDNSHEIPYQIYCFNYSTVQQAFSVLYTKEERYNLIYSGINQMKDQCIKWFAINDEELH